MGDNSILLIKFSWFKCAGIIIPSFKSDARISLISRLSITKNLWFGDDSIVK